MAVSIESTTGVVLWTLSPGATAQFCEFYDGGTGVWPSEPTQHPSGNMIVQRDQATEVELNFTINKGIFAPATRFKLRVYFHDLTGAGANHTVNDFVSITAGPGAQVVNKIISIPANSLQPGDYRVTLMANLWHPDVPVPTTPIPCAMTCDLGIAYVMDAV